jgi:hypothetical protein
MLSENEKKLEDKMEMPSKIAKICFRMCVRVRTSSFLFNRRGLEGGAKETKEDCKNLSTTLWRMPVI